VANEKVDAAKKRYERGLKSELDPDELGRIALIVEETARVTGEFETARHYAELAVGHYSDVQDEKLVVHAKRRLAAALFMVRDWDAALPLVDAVMREPEGRDAVLSKADGIKDPKARAIELARALVTWGSASTPGWVVVWGALWDAFSGDPIASELERRLNSLLRSNNADAAGKLRMYGFPAAAAHAATGGAKKTPSSGAEWLELAAAQRAQRKLAAAYDSFCEAARHFEKTYDRKSNAYTDEEVDEDRARYLRGEDRFDHKASRAWRDAAECAFRIGDRAKMDAAYDRELLRRFDVRESKAIGEVRAALAAGRKDDALDLVRAKMRFSKCGTPEVRALMRGVIEEHVAAGRIGEALAVHDEILHAVATTWGKDSPAYPIAELDLASTLVDVGYVGQARPIVESVAKTIKEAAGEDPFGCVSMLAKIDAAKGVELLECVRSTRFSTAKERLARIDALVASGAKVATTDGAGDNVLHHAARLRAADSGWLVHELVEAGAPRDAKNAAGEKPIDVAATNPAEVADAVEALFEKDASSALDIAAANGNLVTVARLLSLGAGPAPAALARPFPKDARLVEFALRVARKTGSTEIVDAAFSDAPPDVHDVRKHVLAFAAHAGEDMMKARFGGADREKLIAELVYTISSDEILETLVKEDWTRFAREDLALLRASIPADIDDELGDEKELIAESTRAFRSAAFDASPPEIREEARLADFGK
jgi:hypothetical protein